MSRKSLFEIIKNANNDNSLADSFLNDFIYTIEKSDMDNKRKPSRSFKPSNLRCNRASVLEVMGAKLDDTKTTHNLIAICRNGTDTHLAIQEYVNKMKNYGIDWEFVDVGKYIEENNIPLEITRRMDISNGVYETKVNSKEYNIHCLCDGLLRHDGKYILLEIKTIGSRPFYRLNDVLEKHKQQAISYCTLFRVDSIIFLYQERDLLNKKAFLYKPTQKEKDDWVSKMKYLNDCVSKNIVPAKPIEADSKFCQYCNYKTICKSIGGDEAEFSEEL